MNSTNLYLQQLQQSSMAGSGNLMATFGAGVTTYLGNHTANSLQRTIYQPIGPVVLGPGADSEPAHFSLPRLNESQRTALENARKYAMDMSIKTALMKQNAQLQQNQSANVKRNQAIVLLSRIYIGSINYDVREDMLKQTFNIFGPVKSVTLSYDPLTNKHKGFCFLEFELPESAQLALEQMNGFPMSGRGIKVGRPSNMPNAQKLQEELIAESKLYNRIFIASVHPDLSEDDLKMVFEAFGKIISCKLEPDHLNPTKHRGFGFIEYDSPQSANDAIHSMNMFDLGGQLLRVGRAITPPLQITDIGTNSNTFSSIGTSQTPIMNSIRFDGPVQTTTIPQAAMSAAASINAQVMSNEVSKYGIGGVSPAASSPQSTGYVNSPTAAVPPPTVVIPKLKSRPSKFTMAPKPVTSSAVTVNEPADTTISATIVKNESVAEQSHLPEKETIEEVKREEVEDNSDKMDNFSTLAEQETFQIKGVDARTLLMQKLQRKILQRTLVLRNMVGSEDIDEFLEEEITEECSKHGTVERVVIYQERVESDDDIPFVGEERPPEKTIVKIFVLFYDEQSVQLAIESLNGRFFAGKVIKAESYDQQLFDAKDLSH